MLPLNRLFFSTFTNDFGTLFVYSPGDLSVRRERKITKFIKRLDKIIEVYWTIYYFEKYKIFVFRNDNYLRNFIKLLTSTRFSNIPLTESIYLVYNYNIQDAQNRIKFF